MTVLILESPGSKVRAKGHALIASVPKDPAKPCSKDVVEETYSARELSGIIMGVGGYVTYKARKILLKNGVPIIWKDTKNILGVTYTFHSHGTVYVRREQFHAIEDYRGLWLAKQFIKGACENKRRLLNYYARNREPVEPVEETPEYDPAEAAVTTTTTTAANADLVAILRNATEHIEKQQFELNKISGSVQDTRLLLMGIEGAATRIYHDALAQLIPEHYNFHGRNRRPPKDPINAALSYGYIILNGYSFMALSIAGLDPYAGFLHVDRSGRRSLALDLSEEFRQVVVDRAVIALATTHQFDLGEDFRYQPDSVLLSKSGIVKLVGKMQELLSKQTRTCLKADYTLEHHILLQSRKISRYLVKKDASYEPFVIQL